MKSSGTRETSKSIKSTVSIHDRTQVETVFSYYMDAGEPEELLDQQYRVDAFIFFPVQTGINPSTYTRQQFYNDLRALIRLREPRLTYKELMGLPSKRSNVTSPLCFVRDFVERIKRGEEDDRIRLATDEARVFGCSFVSYFWRRVERRCRRLIFIENALRTASADEIHRVSARFTENTILFFDKGFELLREWRKLLTELRDLGRLQLQPLQFEMELVDEYIAYCFRDGLLRVLKSIDEHTAHFEPASVKVLQHKIHVYLRYEKFYARAHHFSWVNEESEKSQKENYVYRRGALKRRVWSVLYLNPRQDFIFKFQKQVGPMIAASFASGWALAASLFIWSHSAFRGFQFYDTLSLGGAVLVSTMFIFAYVLKDRIKELGRSWFERGLFRNGPDLANTIYYHNADGERLRIGTVKEAVDFVKSEKIPDSVLMLRKLHLQKHYKFDDAYGAVIHYRKQIRISPRQLTRLQQPIRAVHDIIRLNISSFLARLDDPLHLSLALDRHGHAIETQMPKVYHIDFVLKYWPLAPSKDQPILDYYRIIVDKKGMSRIEQLK